jgi:DtxR family Mn-dependent transcriptional regulator
MPVNRRVNVNTESVDNYLKAIFALSGQEKARVSSTALAERLGVAPASITDMLQKLASASQSFVEYERYRGVRLSPIGERRALEVLRHHRLIETYLYEVLDFPIEDVHEEAERLEHFISERLEERIATKLDHPKFDPHGHCIPAMDGKMPNETSEPLANIKKHGRFVVDSVSDRDALLLKRLNAHGIIPGALLQIKSVSPHEFVLRTGAAENPLRLSRGLAGAIRLRTTVERHS